MVPTPVHFRSLYLLLVAAGLIFCALASALMLFSLERATTLHNGASQYPGPPGNIPETASPGAPGASSKIVMVTGSSGTNRMLEIPHIREMVYENRRTYADLHGYASMWANMTSYNIAGNASIYWSKIPILSHAFNQFPEAEWVWWMDMDIIIINLSLKIYDHVLSEEGMAQNIVRNEPLQGAGGEDTGYCTPKTYEHDNVNFVVSTDFQGINVGNFLIRRSEWSKWLLSLWTEPLYVSQDWTHPENDAWTHMWHFHQIVRGHTAVMRQRSMNAYPDVNCLGEHWSPGDHIVHFAGCGDGVQCEAEWKRYWDLRENVEVPIFIHNELKDGTAAIESFQGT